ncbi:rho guanine nucleotide exchange factor 8-like [Cucurbita maxima]|uniref:Rho guanine nucleotide exchange factor 8-like n=1 Tax=Cucurbita maxima TaxID=3661 RepID=A0A6J1HKZ0_CUCMA|nr:rho guanine nucleotide exchange factor 8-like [Cucurbita maxima]
MVRAVIHQPNLQHSRSFHLKRVVEIPGRQTHSLILESGEESDASRHSLQPEQIGWALSNNNKDPVSCFDTRGIKARGPRCQPKSELELMMAKFAKLLLGEDMSGGGKGVSSALALSNAITNLAASTFGEQKLETLSPEKKARWRREIEWFLSVTDHIVEFVPSKQKSKAGIDMEIMVTVQRKDLLMSIPALTKLDVMLIGFLDQFGKQQEFWYVSRDDESANDNTQQRNGDKWWLPAVKVPPNGLSEANRKWLLFVKESVNQILKAAMAINAQVLTEMEVPESYIESLPKNGKTSLGEAIYRSITEDYFNPDEFLKSMDLSTEHKVIDLKNRIEASIVIWKRKMHHKDGKSSWGSAVSFEKREIFEERVESILFLIKQYFPGISQSSLDMSKIQHNRDVGQAILESYSRVIESLAFNMMSRIEDVLYADTIARELSIKQSLKNLPVDEEDKSRSNDSEASKTLSDFMGWDVDKDNPNFGSLANEESCWKQQEDIDFMSKPAKIATQKRFSYLEKLESLSALRSPTARH